MNDQPEDDRERCHCAEHEGKCILCHDHQPLMILYLTPFHGLL